MVVSSDPSGRWHDCFNTAINRSTSGILFPSRYNLASLWLVLNHKRSLLDPFNASNVISYISDRTRASVAAVNVSKMALMASVHSFRVTAAMNSSMPRYRSAICS